MIDYAALRNEILSGPLASECAPHVLDGTGPKVDGVSAARKDQAIADILNRQDYTRVVETFVNDIGLLSTLGAQTGAAILDKLESAQTVNRPLKWAFRALTSERGLDVGHPQTRAMLDALTPSVFLASERDALKALAVQPASRAQIVLGEPVSAAQVSIALRGGNEFTPE